MRHSIPFPSLARHLHHRSTLAIAPLRTPCKVALIPDTPLIHPSLFSSKRHLNTSSAIHSSLSSSSPPSIAGATTTTTSTTSTTTTTSGPTCPSQIPRPRLPALPYIYLRDLPYNRGSDLQQYLVDRQIRLRKERVSAKKEQTGKDNEEEERISHDLLLIVEHTPTYTNGRRNRGNQAIGDEETNRLKNLGATYVESLRGGEITYHGPGQLVAYPILDLKPIELSVRCYVSYLEKAIIATCADWGIKAITTENTGVWLNDQQKIAAIGVHVQRYITSHGLALNCNTDLEFFKQIIACGLNGKETTSLGQELKDPTINVQSVIPSFIKGFAAVFERQVVPLSQQNKKLESVLQEYCRTGNLALLKSLE
ncbi:putative lipoyltransferase 2, mitochondrial [Podila humilis]|nr:putative lipoyltransferase 2, mitochondrial [Podila humilis]